jgi:multisubunit Na+/H+ antiporter MnhF subunit
MQLIFNIIATLLFFFFGVIWSKKTFLDVIMKLICIILSFVGMVLIFHNMGYVIKN